MDESFILTKNNYEDSTKTIFKNLLKDVEFTDVTLALNDEKQVKGHKAILGASSSFFRKIFQQNAVANLVLYLKGISTKDMNSIMEFIYLGQTSVNKADLNTFLEVAEELKIEGLMQTDKASMSATNSDLVPEIKIDDELTESTGDEEDGVDNSSMNQSTFETSSSLDSSMRDTSVNGHNISIERTFQMTPKIISTMTPLPVSREDQDQAAMIVANFMMNTGANKLDQNDSILNDKENIDSDQPITKNEHTEEPELKQDICKLFPFQGSSLDSRVTSDQPRSEKIKKYNCSNCDFSTAHKMSLKRHMHLIHGIEESNPPADPKKHCCTTCSFSTDHYTSLKRHMDNIHAELPIQDMECENSENAGLPTEILSESSGSSVSLDEPGIEKTKKYVCGECGISVSLKYSLKRHLQKLHGQEAATPPPTEPKKHSCTRCSFATDYDYSLKRHIDKVHPSIQDMDENVETAEHQFSSPTEMLSESVA